MIIFPRKRESNLAFLVVHGSKKDAKYYEK